ncbi:MAG: metallophosphoesterase [Deltaproteobacteria bacterium]|nr:metallophosphoesterase [Deltaproteobacteria bacterium]
MRHSTIVFVSFILVVLIVYISAHFYIYYRMKKSLEFGRITNLVVGMFFVVMILSPFIIKISSSKGLNLISIFFTYTGYMWMGIITILVIILLFLDTIHIIVMKLLTLYDVRKYQSIDKYLFLIALSASLLATAIGFFEAKNIKVNNIRLESNNLPKQKPLLRIVQISDLHISQTLGSEFVSKVVEKIKNIQYDILVITGDTIDIDPRKNKKIVNALSSLSAPLGKYGVTGNHEFYTGIEISLDFYRMCGIRLLRGEKLELIDGIVLVGVDDDNGERFSNYSDISEEDLITTSDKMKYVILLKHKPFVNDKIKDKVDIQLSGHVHGGQFFPFSLIVGQLYKYFQGLYKISERMYLYVSRGTGYWGPPIRFMTPPEITVIEIKRKE